MTPLGRRDGRQTPQTTPHLVEAILGAGLGTDQKAAGQKEADMTIEQMELEAMYRLAKFFKDNGFTEEQRERFGQAMVEAAAIAARETAKRL